MENNGQDKLSSKQALEDLVFKDLEKAVVKCCVNIIMGHPSDIIKFDMKEFNNDTYFISNHNIEKGKVYSITDESLKYTLYEFCKEYPDRCWRGEKDNG